jgi:hypothetical protein
MSGLDGLEISTRVPLSQTRMGACDHVPSCQALSSTTSQESSCYGAGPTLKGPRLVMRIHNDQAGG